jgi:hypothetical protein
MSGSTSSGPGLNCEIDVMGQQETLETLLEELELGVVFNHELRAGRAEVRELMAAQRSTVGRPFPNIISQLNHGCCVRKAE